METDAAEKPGVAEGQGALRLLENNVIVVLGPEAGWLDAQFSGHTEMEAEPVPSRELEQHLFSPRLRTEKTAPGQLANDGAWIRAAENPLQSVELDALDCLTQSRVPLATKKFYFG
jgi:hypothetical protein